MSGKDGIVRDDHMHQALLSENGHRKITKEQQEIMDKIMGNTAQFTLENENPDPECTLDLPILKRLEKNHG